MHNLFVFIMSDLLPQITTITQSLFTRIPIGYTNPSYFSYDGELIFTPPLAPPQHAVLIAAVTYLFPPLSVLLYPLALLFSAEQPSNLSSRPL